MSREPRERDLGLVRHLERYLGPIQGGWNEDEDGSELPFWVVRFGRAPVPTAVAFTTLGLSNHDLESPRSGRALRQELVAAAYAQYAHWNIPEILQQIAKEAWAGRRAYLAGEVLGPRGRLWQDVGLEAWYFTVPVYFPDGFGVYKAPSGLEVQMAWAIPIHASEAIWCREHGWSAFEELLTERDPDLLDLEREPVA